MPEELLAQLLRLPVGRVKPPVENGSLILQSKITRLLRFVSDTVGLRLDVACEKDAPIDIIRASGTSISAETRIADPKLNAGGPPSVSRGGGRMRIIEFGNPIASGSGVKNYVGRRKPRHCQQYQTTMAL